MHEVRESSALILINSIKINIIRNINRLILILIDIN